MTAQILQFPAMDSSSLPNRIREHRIARGLKLEDVAQDVGCSAVQISDLERGRRTLNDNWMRRIARALDVTPGDLLLEKDNSLSLSADESDLVRRYRAADDATRQKIRAMMDVLAPAPGKASAA